MVKRADAGISGDALTATEVSGGTTTANQATFTTGSDGTVTIDALQTNDFINNADVTNPGWYCLVETKAPEGYELQSGVITFQVLKANVIANTDADGNVLTYTLDLTVTDVPSNAGFRLPLTGANGILFLTIAGVLLVGGAVLLAVHNKRRSAQAERTNAPVTECRYSSTTRGGVYESDNSGRTRRRRPAGRSANPLP
ncbi:SpaH/EbpB family LPXTG-anchored major pilin [Actinomyces ruminis]|uniref:SpaH/EbpB family LPXTG-anchored major pilin n=1 Tax=Actinomyces ruminis TaxID=1937003 RepID=UPI00211E5746|nr:SpaH/EbpB family LPXTG-anchored major pilin [Actinomyces ruminis]